MKRSRSITWGIAAAAIASLWTAVPTWACAVCGGDRDSDMVKGAEAGVLTMVVITYGVLLCFGAMVVACFVRSRRLRRTADSSNTPGE